MDGQSNRPNHNRFLKFKQNYQLQTEGVIDKNNLDCIYMYLQVKLQ